MNLPKPPYILTSLIAFLLGVILLTELINILLILSQFLCFDTINTHTVEPDNLGSKYPDYTHYINTLFSRYNNSESPGHSSIYGQFNCFNTKSHNIPTALHELKNKLRETTGIITHKFKVFDRTLSWFFKGSKPGGGRGL